MIEFKDVSSSYDATKPVLKDLSFRIPDGSSVGLIGANGAGKSTILKTVLGLQPYSGDIIVDGMRVEKENLSEIRKRIGYVMQDSDNQMFMPRVYDDMTFGPRNYGIKEDELEAKADEVLEKLNIEHLKYSYNHKLSGGEKKMASIAAILMLDPDILIMDEPTSMLDPYNRRIILNTVNGLSQTKLIASHDLDFIYDTCELCLLIYGGEVMAFDSSDTVLRDRELLERCHLELPYRFM